MVPPHERGRVAEALPERAVVHNHELAVLALFNHVAVHEAHDLLGRGLFLCEPPLPLLPKLAAHYPHVSQVEVRHPHKGVGELMRYGEVLQDVKVDAPAALHLLGPLLADPALRLNQAHHLLPAAEELEPKGGVDGPGGAVEALLQALAVWEEVLMLESLALGEELHEHILKNIKAEYITYLSHLKLLGGARVDPAGRERLQLHGRVWVHLGPAAARVVAHQHLRLPQRLRDLQIAVFTCHRLLPDPAHDVHLLRPREGLQTRLEAHLERLLFFREVDLHDQVVPVPDEVVALLPIIGRRQPEQITPRHQLHVVVLVAVHAP